MKESQEQNTIDLFVAFLRKLVDSSRGHWDDWNKQILLVFGVDDHNKLNFIIDSLYLIEDTQLAKSNFREFGASGPTKYKNFGEAYLRIYGIYNACYLQKQAILRIACELNITFDKKTSQDMGSHLD